VRESELQQPESSPARQWVWIAGVLVVIIGAGAAWLTTRDRPIARQQYSTVRASLEERARALDHGITLGNGDGAEIDTCGTFVSVTFSQPDETSTAVMLRAVGGGEELFNAPTITTPSATRRFQACGREVTVELLDIDYIDKRLTLRVAGAFAN